MLYRSAHKAVMVDGRVEAAASRRRERLSDMTESQPSVVDPHRGQASGLQPSNAMRMLNLELGSEHTCAMRNENVDVPQCMGQRQR